MIVILCIDESGGMMFNHRRQSQDMELKKNILKRIKGKKLWMNEYSSRQFTKEELKGVDLQVSEEFLQKAEDGEFCFVENSDLCLYLACIEEIILFKWNRKYPADFYFQMERGLWKLAKSKDFIGHSHENITMEIYKR